MWNPFSRKYTPVKNPVLRAVVAVLMLPLQLVFWAVVGIHNGIEWAYGIITGEQRS